MKVFLSWSGPRSHAVALLLKGWLSSVIQAIEPWISSDDIDRGSIWFNDIQDQLKDCSTGIICVTAENLVRPWLLFEAGALAKGLKASRVITLLIDLEPANLAHSPLSHFNATAATKDGISKMMKTLNDRTDKPLDESMLLRAIDRFWPDFGSGYQAALDEHVTEAAPEVSEKVMLAEILESVRRMERERIEPERKVGEQLPLDLKRSIIRGAEEKTFAQSLANLLGSRISSDSSPSLMPVIYTVSELERLYAEGSGASGSKHTDETPDETSD